MKRGKEEDNFRRVLSSVDKVAVEEVPVGRTRGAVAVPNEVKRVQVPMRIADNGQAFARLHRDGWNVGQALHAAGRCFEQTECLSKRQPPALVEVLHQAHHLIFVKRELKSRASILGVFRNMVHSEDLMSRFARNRRDRRNPSRERTSYCAQLLQLLSAHILHAFAKFFQVAV